MELHKYLSFCDKFDLQGQSQGHQFLTRQKPQNRVRQFMINNQFEFEGKILNG